MIFHIVKFITQSYKNNLNYNVLIFILNLKDMKKQLLILPLILLLLYSCKTTKSSCDAYGSNNTKESKTTSK